MARFTGNGAGHLPGICLLIAALIYGNGGGCSNGHGSGDTGTDPSGDQVDDSDTSDPDDPGDTPPDGSDPDAGEEAELPACTAPPACGSSGPPVPGSVGEPCATHDDCGPEADTCLAERSEVFDGETYVSWQGGTCARAGAGGDGCDPEVASSCPSGSRCVHLGWGASCSLSYACLDACDASSPWNCGCRAGYKCDPAQGVCLPGCSNDRECCESWSDADSDLARDPAEVAIDAGCSNLCEGDDPIEFEWTGCMASFECANAGDPSASFGSPCAFDSDCPARAECLEEHASWEECDEATSDPDGPLGLHARFPGGMCVLVRCDLPGRECPVGVGGECVNLGTSTVPFYACWASCQTGHGPGDPLNPCRDDDLTRAYTCSPYPGSCWLSPSTIGADGLCLPAVINDVTTPNLGEACVDESTCYSPLGLGACWTAMGVSICTVSCNQSLAEDQSICGAPASAGEVAPGVCIGLCVAGCSTPLGALGSNGCPTVDQACYPNDGSYNGGDMAFRDSTATDPAGFCLPACTTNADCAEFWSGSTSCNTTSGVCGS